VRVPVVLILLGALAAADDVSARIDALGSQDPYARASARRWLVRHLDECGPALERALDSADAETRASVSWMLAKAGRLGSFVRNVIPRPDLDALCSSDPRQRRLVAMRLARRGDVGMEALRLVYGAGRAPAVRLQPERTTVYASRGKIRVHLVNDDQGPGWVGWPEGHVGAKWRRGFGRSVTFFGFAGRGFGRRMRARRGVRYGAVVNTAGKFEWLAPGQAGANIATLTCDLPWPGVWAATAAATVRERKVVLRDRDRGLELTKIRVNCAEHAPGAFDIHAIPGPNTWGRPVDATKLRATLDNGAVVLRLISDGKTLAPADFSSSWYVLLDAKGQVIDYGPLDRGDAKGARVYKREELTAVKDLKFRVPAPRRGAFVLYGTRFTRGSAWGAEAVSDRLPLR
jgi:hypothetical protein